MTRTAGSSLTAPGQQDLAWASDSVASELDATGDGHEAIADTVVASRSALPAGPEHRRVDFPRVG
jgi:hypothetical protein